MRPIVLLIITQRRDVCEELAPRKIRVNAPSRPVIARPKVISLRGLLTAAPALSWPARHRSAGSVT